MATRKYDGLFIVFEGIDGAGTSTQCDCLASQLRGKRRVTHVTCEPSGGPVGSVLRLGLSGRMKLGSSKMAETMALLFAADRLDHLATEIEPLLRDGTVVLCDRYDLSSIVYQSATAREEDSAEFEQWVRTLNRYALRPDLTIVLDVEPEVAERRRNMRVGALELYEESHLQRKLALLYAEAERLVPGDQVVHVDGGGSVDEVAAAIRAAVDGLLE